MKVLVKGTIAMLLALGMLSACDGGTETVESNIKETTADEIVASEKESDASEVSSNNESADDTEKASESIAQTEKVSETETTETKIEAKLPDGEADLSYICADGYVMSQYNKENSESYLSACSYYENEGYSLYCSSEVGGLVSSTYRNGDGYVTVSFNSATEELYLGKSADGAILPDFGELGAEKCEITVTQRSSTEINGMTYAIRLSDGSFVVIDGGYKQEAKTLYELLCKLNGSADNIHIRAWLMTHSHGDHYQAFNQFSKDFATKVKLDYFLYSPITGAANQDSYLNNTAPADVARFAGAKMCGVHAGMVLDLGCLELQILIAPEHVFKTNAPEDFNESSIVCRAVNDEGSMIFLADSGINAANWMMKTYGESLKSDMVQVAHHGCETTPAELYDMIAANTLFWPCSESLFNTNRGELVKQHIIEAEYSKEHLLHGYGDITRPLSYKAETVYLDVFPKTERSVIPGKHVTGVRIEDGVLKYEVAEAEKPDPYVSFALKNVSTKDYNAIRIVVDSKATEGGCSLYFTCGSDTNFSSAKSNGLGVTGKSDDGKTTLIAYIGDVEGFSGKLTSLRLDFGSEAGQTVSIYSVELFHVDIDE